MGMSIYVYNIYMSMCIYICVYILYYIYIIIIIFLPFLLLQLLRTLRVHDASIGMTLSSITLIFGAVIIVTYIDILGRRFALLLGCFNMVLVWAIGAVVMAWMSTPYGVQEGYTSDLVRFLFGGLLCVCSFSFSASLCTMAWVLTAEIYPLWCRGRCVSGM